MVTGGHYDVDVTIMDPHKNVIYKEVKKQYDSHTWTATITGEYRVCFSNEFSTFSHKLVYVDFQVGDEDPLPGVGEHLTAMTQVCQSSSFMSSILQKRLEKCSVMPIKFFLKDAQPNFNCGKVYKTVSLII